LITKQLSGVEHKVNDEFCLLQMQKKCYTHNVLVDDLQKVPTVDIRGVHKIAIPLGDSKNIIEKVQEFLISILNV
jgi:hypothetical protein